MSDRRALSLFRHFAPVARDQKGAVATEYAILIAFICLIIIAGVGAYGDALNTWFTDVLDSLPF